MARNMLFFRMRGFRCLSGNVGLAPLLTATRIACLWYELIMLGWSMPLVVLLSLESGQIQLGNRQYAMG